MSVLIARGAARRLVVEPGDRVCATGSFIRFPDGDWLDLAQVVPLVGHTGPWKSPNSLRLLGVDPDAVPDGSDPALIPGQLCATGQWHADAITVESQRPRRRPPRTRGPWLLGADEPVDGWDNTNKSTDIDGLPEFRDSGQIVRDEWLRVANGAYVLRVAASDVDGVHAVLGPQLPRRLHVVSTHYTAAQLRAVDEVFDTPASEWGFESWGSSIDGQGQPYAEVSLTRVCREFATWADTLPDGLLTVNAAMTPAGELSPGDT